MTNLEVTKDLRPIFGPARDQHQRPTCLAFAASDAHAALRNGWYPLSCEYAFYHAQQRAGRSPDSGALLGSMLDAIHHDGQPLESGWNYLPKLPNDLNAWIPPDEVGELFNRNGSTSTHSVNVIIEQLDKGVPVIMLMMLSRSFYRIGPDGVVNPGPDEGPDPLQRHAIVAVGHGKVGAQPAILVRNSWGERWGIKGHAWLTERYLKSRLFGAAILLENIDVSGNPVTS